MRVGASSVRIQVPLIGCADLRGRSRSGRQVRTSGVALARLGAEVGAASIRHGACRARSFSRNPRESS